MSKPRESWLLLPEKAAVLFATPLASTPRSPGSLRPPLVVFVAAAAWLYRPSFMLLPPSAGAVVRVNRFVAGLKTSALFTGVPSEP